jgi:L-serine dehydratase
LGGGFIARQGDESRYGAHSTSVPFPFNSGSSLINFGHVAELTIASIMLENERVQRSREDIEQGIDRLADVMLACIDRGLATEGKLPGGMKVKRRAKQIFEGLNSEKLNNVDSPARAFEYVSAFAIAVNEENASGGRIVTAPTNGAAGVIPAVLRYYKDFCPSSSRAGIQTFFLQRLRSVRSSSAMHQSPAQRSVAKEKSDPPLQWPRRVFALRSVDPMSKSKTLLRLLWSITSA